MLDRFQRLGRAMLEEIAEGHPVRRREAVALARAVLESEVVRAAEAVFEADDETLTTRLVELLKLGLEPAADAETSRLLR